MAAPTNLWPPGSADKTMQSKYDYMKSLAVLYYFSLYRNALHNLSAKVIMLVSRSLNRAHLFYNAKYHLLIKGTIRSL